MLRKETVTAEMGVGSAAAAFPVHHVSSLAFMTPPIYCGDSSTLPLAPPRLAASLPPAARGEHNVLAQVALWVEVGCTRATWAERSGWCGF